MNPKNLAISGDRNHPVSLVRISSTLGDRLRERLTKLPSLALEDVAQGPLLAALEKKYGVKHSALHEIAKATVVYLADVAKLDKPATESVGEGCAHAAEHIDRRIQARQHGTTTTIPIEDRTYDYIRYSRENPPPPASPAMTTPAFQRMLDVGQTLASQVVLALVTNSSSTMALRSYDDAPDFAKTFISFQLLRIIDWNQLFARLDVGERVHPELTAAVLRLIKGDMP